MNTFTSFSMDGNKEFDQIFNNSFLQNPFFKSFFNNQFFPISIKGNIDLGNQNQDQNINRQSFSFSFPPENLFFPNMNPSINQNN